MKKHKNKVKRNAIKLENFIITNSATAGSFVFAFLCCWGIPVQCVVDACRTESKDKKLMDKIADSYPEYVINMSNKPVETFNKYKEIGRRRLQQFDENHR